MKFLRTIVRTYLLLPSHPTHKSSQSTTLSSPRRRGSTPIAQSVWIPAFAGMTERRGKIYAYIVFRTIGIACLTFIISPLFAQEPRLDLMYSFQYEERLFIEGGKTFHEYAQLCTTYLKTPSSPNLSSTLETRLKILPEFTAKFALLRTSRAPQSIMKTLNLSETFHKSRSSPSPELEHRSRALFYAALFNRVLKFYVQGTPDWQRTTLGLFTASETWLPGSSFEDITAFLDTYPNSVYAQSMYALWKPVALREIGFEIRSVIDRELATDEDSGILQKLKKFHTRYGNTHEQVFSISVP